MILLRRTSHYVSTATLLLAVATCAFAQSQNSPRRDGDPNTEPSNRSSTTSTPSIVNQIFESEGQRQPTAAQQSNFDQFVNNALTDPIVLLTAVLIACGIGQIVIYRNQLATTKAIERAWVSLHHLEIEPPLNHNGELTIAATFRNSGRSTARIVRANITLRSAFDDKGNIRLLDDIPDEPTYDSTPPVIPPAILVADETSTMRISANEFSTLNRWQLGGSDSLWIYGYVEYTDGLTPKRIRRYGWARRFDKDLSLRTPGGYKSRFTHVNRPAYNYAD